MTDRDSKATQATQSFSSREQSATEKKDSSFSDLLQQIHAGSTTLQITTKLKEKALNSFSLLEDKESEGTLTYQISKNLGKQLSILLHAEPQTCVC